MKMKIFAIAVALCGVMMVSCNSNKAQEAAEETTECADTTVCVEKCCPCDTCTCEECVCEQKCCEKSCEKCDSCTCEACACEKQCAAEECVAEEK